MKVTVTGVRWIVIEDSGMMVVNEDDTVVLDHYGVVSRQSSDDTFGGALGRVGPDHVVCLGGPNGLWEAFVRRGEDQWHPVILSEDDLQRRAGIVEVRPWILMGLPI